MKEMMIGLFVTIVGGVVVWYMTTRKDNKQSSKNSNTVNLTSSTVNGDVVSGDKNTTNNYNTKDKE